MSDKETEKKVKKPRKSKSRSVPIAKPDEECMRNLLKTFRSKYAPILRANKCQLFASHEEKKNVFIIPMLETLNEVVVVEKKSHAKQDKDSDASSDDDEKPSEVKEKVEQIEPIFIQRKLHAGDFWIRLNGKLIYLIERKSIQDLSGSIGARMRQQKYKCKRMPIPASRVIYLTEGKKPARVFMKDSSTLMGALVDILVRDRMTIIHQPNDESTFMWLVKLLIKVCEFVIGTVQDSVTSRNSHARWTEELNRQKECPLDFNPLGAFDSETGYKQVEEKKEDEKLDSDSEDDQLQDRYMTQEEMGYVEAYCPDGWHPKPSKSVANPKTWYIGALCGIRLIKPYKAEAILAEFPTILDLTGFLVDPTVAEADKIKRIANLTAAKTTKVLQDKSGKKKPKSNARKLGPALAKEVYHHFLMKKYEKE